MSDRYGLDDERRADVDDAITRRQEQGDAGLGEREQDNPAGDNTVSGRSDRDTVVGGHGHGGAIDMEIDKASGS